MNCNQPRYYSLITQIFGMLLGVVALAGCEPADNPGGAGAKRVALFQYADSPLYEHGVRGMVEGLKAKGFSSPESLQLTTHNALRNTETAEDIAQEIAAGDFDLILTSGTQALQAVAKANQGGKTVQVFGLVANPFNAGVGLDANDPLKHPRNLIGVGSFPPVEPVFQLAKEVHPELKVVGVVWNPDETNSQEGMEKARKISSELGIELLEARASKPEEVGNAAKTLVGKGAEILWIGPDNTAHHAAGQVIAAAKAGGIPVMSSLPGDAARGALMDLSHNWHEVGTAVGSMAGEVLSGTDPSTIPIAVHPDRLQLVLNERALAGLNAPWRFPQIVVQRANEVIAADK